jgi:hypothetical protein
MKLRASPFALHDRYTLEPEGPKAILKTNLDRFRYIQIEPVSAFGLRFAQVVGEPECL